MPRVFISHSSKDRERVEREIVATLHASGIGTWFATEAIHSGELFQQRIRDGLSTCDWFLVAVTSHAIASEWVQAEVEWAMEHRHGRVLPVLLDDFCRPEELHLKLMLLHFIDLRTPSPAALSRLVAWWTPECNDATPAALAPTPPRGRIIERGEESASDGYAPIAVLEDRPDLVLRAHDARRNADVVIRVVDTSAWADESRHHLLDAARMSMRLVHPAVARTLAVDEVTRDAENRPVKHVRIVTELVSDARGLDAFIAGTPELDRAPELLARAAAGLHYCHVRGYVNGRLHPRTILVNEHGPHLIDLGIIRAAQRLANDQTRLANTQSSSFVAPEVYVGEDPTPRSDVFSIGVMLYEALAARRPFESLNPGEYFSRGKTPGSPIAIRSPRQIDPRIPAPLDRICMKCLAADPANRYASAADLSDDLRLWKLPIKRWFFR